MDKTRIIRGRKVVFERKDPVGDLRFTLDVFDERDNLVEVLGRLADLSVAQAVYEAISRQPYTCELHDFRPLLGFITDEFAELSGRTGH
jgi:hypothetical protein